MSGLKVQLANQIIATIDSGFTKLMISHLAAQRVNENKPTSIHDEIISHVKLIVKDITKFWPIKFCFCCLLKQVHQTFNFKLVNFNAKQT